MPQRMSALATRTVQGKESESKGLVGRNTLSQSNLASESIALQAASSFASY